MRLPFPFPSRTYERTYERTKPTVSIGSMVQSQLLQYNGKKFRYRVDSNYSNTPLFHEKHLIFVFQESRTANLKLLFHYPNTSTASALETTIRLLHKVVHALLLQSIRLYNLLSRSKALLPKRIADIYT